MRLTRGFTHIPQILHANPSKNRYIRIKKISSLSYWGGK